MEKEGAVIDRVEIAAGDVFDLEDPGQNHLLGRLANVLHIRSRDSIVARELLFGEGEAVNAALIRETERNLRALSYITDADVVAVADGDGTLRAVVETDDAWSLKGGFKFRYEAGEAEWGVDVEEVNLLGFGKALRLGYEDTKERETLLAGYRDPRLLGSRWQLRASYEDLSDGRRRRFSLRRPFFALETGWAALASLFAEESSVRLYDLGDEVLRLPSTFDEARFGIWKAFPAARRSVLRVGLEYRVDDAVYGAPVIVRESPLTPPAPDDRDLRGVFVAGQFLQDRHFVARNMTSIGKTEDVNAGWDVRGEAGFFGGAFGGQSAFAAELDISRAWRPGPETTAKTALGVEGRLRDGRWEETLAGISLSLYDQRLPRQTLAFRTSLAGGNRLAPENRLYIGAGSGLRGYPGDFRSGNRRWIAQFEDRIITDHVFWGMAQLGFVVFADAGAVKRFDTGEWSRVYADAGGGLRIGNLKSAYGRIVLLTIAFPLVEDESVSDFEIFAGTGLSF